MILCKMHKIYIFFKKKFKKKIRKITLPKIFRPVTRNTLIFLFGLIIMMTLVNDFILVFVCFDDLVSVLVSALPLNKIQYYFVYDIKQNSNNLLTRSGY